VRHALVSTFFAAHHELIAISTNLSSTPFLSNYPTRMKMRMTYSSRIGADLRYQVMREGLDGEPRNSSGKGLLLATAGHE